jgi:hypothetical protein
MLHGRCFLRCCQDFWFLFVGLFMGRVIFAAPLLLAITGKIGDVT